MELIDEIVQSFSSINEVELLDRSSDPDHNRTVLTIAGPLKPVGQAAFLAIRKAAELIDMDLHQGEHPRLGATDVVPFVPLGDTEMKECVDLARSLGKQVGEQLQIPVYLYEQAALIPERKNLEAVRKGEYELLKKDIGVKTERAPDFGPTELGKAGAVIIGARQPLIAYNVYLDTRDVEIARKIARAVRFSSGGLRYVKALGMEVDGLAQVSMNLTDYSRTPIARVQEMIRREAQRFGVAIHHAELIGLIPERAVVDTVEWYLQLEELDSAQILESRLRDRVGASEPFLKQLASASPTPGGGSAAAYSGAMAAALARMVAKLTIGKKKYAAVEKRMLEIADQAETLHKELESAVDEDAQAFNQVLDSYRKPKETDEEQLSRAAAIEQATQYAAEIPLAVASRSLEVLRLALELAEVGNKNAISDAAAAGYLAIASIQTAEKNVRINIQSLKAKKQANHLDLQITAIRDESERLSQALDRLLADRANL
jgi:glutamate formiminotransferase/formiminotetrahydrofolate cyclodeaminase